MWCQNNFRLVVGAEKQLQMVIYGIGSNEWVLKNRIGNKSRQQDLLSWGVGFFCKIASRLYGGNDQFFDTLGRLSWQRFLKIKHLT